MKKATIHFERGFIMLKQVKKSAVIPFPLESVLQVEKELRMANGTARSHWRQDVHC